MALTNSDGNYAITTNADKQQVDVTIYRSKTDYTNGLNPFFDHTTNHRFQCGEDLNEALKSNEGSVGVSVAESVILLAEEVIAEQALVDPTRHQVPRYISPDETVYIKGDWIVSV